MSLRRYILQSPPKKRPTTPRRRLRDALPTQGETSIFDPVQQTALRRPMGGPSRGCGYRYRLELLALIARRAGAT